MRKTVIAASVLGAVILLAYGCARTHPPHLPDPQGNATPIKDVATIAHARDIQLEPYDAVDHLYKNAKSQLPTSVRLAILDTAESWAWWADCWQAVYRAAGSQLRVTDRGSAGIARGSTGANGFMRPRLLLGWGARCPASP